MTTEILFATLPLIPAFVLDMFLGDPRILYHPVRIVGGVISFCEKILRNRLPKTNKGELTGGIIIAITVPLVSFLIVWLVLFFAFKLNTVLGIILNVFLCYQMIAAKSLIIESNKVKLALQNNNISLARKQLSYIVGRDTNMLNEREIIVATVETISENTSDGVIAPMYFIGLLGAPLCYFYKSINTLDSMIGYRNAQYEYFGKLSAKFDDFINFVPARLSALAMIIASFFCELDVKGAISIYKRDRKNHQSPNSAQTESVCAGALGIKLGGGGYYSGKYKAKQTIGDNEKDPKISHIEASQRLMVVSAVVVAIFITVIRSLIVFVFYK